MEVVSAGKTWWQFKSMASDVKSLIEALGVKCVVCTRTEDVENLELEAIKCCHYFYLMVIA